MKPRDILDAAVTAAREAAERLLGKEPAPDPAERKRLAGERAAAIDALETEVPVLRRQEAAALAAVEEARAALKAAEGNYHRANLERTNFADDAGRRIRASEKALLDSADGRLRESLDGLQAAAHNFENRFRSMYRTEILRQHARDPITWHKSIDETYLTNYDAVDGLRGEFRGMLAEGRALSLQVGPEEAALLDYLRRVEDLTRRSTAPWFPVAAMEDA